LRLGVPSVPMDGMPQPGEPCPGFIAEPGRCWRMLYSHQLQATHCRQEPAWKGIWTDRKGKGWYVEACRQHAPKLTSAASEGF